MSLIRKHGAVLQAWACLDLVFVRRWCFTFIITRNLGQSPTWCRPAP